MARAKKKQESAMELCLHFPPFLVHVALVLGVGWITSRWNFSLPLVFTLGLVYLYLVEGRIKAKTESKIRSEERRAYDRKRLLSDAETARWLNSTVEAVWPIFLEDFASQKFLMSLAPWFFEKYKPWTAKKVVLQHICMGECPPVFTMLRSGRNPTDGDHLVLEMDMKFVAASDMSAVIAVQMRKRVGFGLWTSLNISNVQIEGKLRIGVRFTNGWPVVERLRICFSEAPILRMTAKPIINYGIDVTDLPGIAKWIDKMIADALEQSLVEPNVLEVEVEKLVGSIMAVYAQLPTPTSTKRAPWFLVGNPDTPLVANVTVEILEGKKLKPSDPNGKADPYVKVRFGSEKRVTAIKHKTLQPAWHEKFHFRVESWDLLPNLRLRVRDKDRFGLDDNMGYKDIECRSFIDGQRHEMWVNLEEVKTGELRIAITVEEVPVVENDPAGTKSNGIPEDGKSQNKVPTLGENVRKSATDSQGHEYNLDDSESDSQECPLKDEREGVDVGYGQLGAVSIVTPGKAEVREAVNLERLDHGRKPAARRVQTDGDGLQSVLGSDCTPSSGELHRECGGGKDLGEGTQGSRKKKVQNIMFKIGKKAHTVGSAISKMRSSKKRKDSGKNLEVLANVNHEETDVPEASTSTGELTGNKEVLEAGNMSGTEREVHATNSMETRTENHESEAETDNHVEFPIASPIIDKKEIPRSEKIKRAEDVRDESSSENPLVEKPTHHTFAFLVPMKAEAHAIKDEAHDVMSKMKAECWTAVSAAESRIHKTVARSHGGSTRSSRVPDASVTKPSNPWSSSTAAPSLSSHFRAPQILNDVVGVGTPQAEDANCAAEPSVVHDDNYEIKSCSPRPCRDDGADSTSSLVEISPICVETPRPAAYSSIVASASGRSDSSANSYEIRCSSGERSSSQLTVSEERGNRGPLSSKVSSIPKGFSFSATKGYEENLHPTAEPPSDEGKVESQFAELSPQTPGAVQEDEIQRRQRIFELANSAGGSPGDSPLFTSCYHRVSSDNESFATMEMTHITSTSLVSKGAIHSEDQISRGRDEHPTITSTFDDLRLNEGYQEITALSNVAEGTSSDSRSMESPNNEEIVVSTFDTSFSRTYGFKEAKAIRPTSTDAVSQNEDASLFSPAENEPGVSDAVSTPEENSCPGPNVRLFAGDEIFEQRSKDISSVGSTSANFLFPRKRSEQPQDIRSVSSRELAPLTERSKVYIQGKDQGKAETKEAESLREASSSDAPSSNECPAGTFFSFPHAKDKFPVREGRFFDVRPPGNSTSFQGIFPKSSAPEGPINVLGVPSLQHNETVESSSMNLRRKERPVESDSASSTSAKSGFLRTKGFKESSQRPVSLSPRELTQKIPEAPTAP